MQWPLDQARRKATDPYGKIQRKGTNQSKTEQAIGGKEQTQGTTQIRVTEVRSDHQTSVKRKGMNGKRNG